MALTINCFLIVFDYFDYYVLIMTCKVFLYFDIIYEQGIYYEETI